MENGDDTVPLEGYVVLAGQITPLDTADDLQWVEKPLDADGVIGAAIVRGDGIEPAYHDGDTVYWGEWSPELAAMVGREVVAELADSRLFLRRLLPGSRAGLYTLVGVGGAAMLDQQVIRAARVRWVKRAD